VICKFCMAECDFDSDGDCATPCEYADYVNFTRPSTYEDYAGDHAPTDPCEGYARGDRVSYGDYVPEW